MRSEVEGTSQGCCSFLQEVQNVQSPKGVLNLSNPIISGDFGMGQVIYRFHLLLLIGSNMVATIIVQKIIILRES